MNIDELPKDALVLLIDADSIPYSIIHNNKFETYEGSGVYDMPDLSIVNRKINHFVNQLYKEVGASHVGGFLGGKGNFRYQVAKTKPYKGNREKTEFVTKWVQYINEYLVQVWDFQLVDGIEADDAVSISSVQLTERGINHLICSNDKDVDTVPGNHYSMSKRKFYHITKDEASFLLHAQYITGDTTDNIPGLKGKGKAYVEKLLRDKTPDKYAESVAWAYKQYAKQVDYLWATYLEEQKALLTLLTTHDSFIPNFHLIPNQATEKSSSFEELDV